MSKDEDKHNEEQGHSEDQAEAPIPRSEDDDKSRILGRDAIALAKTSLVFILIVAGLALVGYLLRFIWVGLLPVILAILVSTVLYPVAAWLRSKGFAPALAAVATLLGAFAIFVGIFSAMAPVVTKQGGTLIQQAESGIGELTKLMNNLPFGIQPEQVQSVTDDAMTFVKNQASNIANGVITGVSTASTIVVSVVIMLFVTFFIIKDGDRFLPWLRKYTGYSAGWHLTELLTRVWSTLAGFIQAQAAVAFVDAVFIGLGLWALQVPLAFVLAVITFFASFIPIIGAFTAGALAVIIALVSHGLTTALLALGLIILVQQLEGNVLQPMLQSKAMGLHATVVLLSVTVGSALAGIVGAFLAVPAAASFAVIFKYHQQMASLRAGEIGLDDIAISTGSGSSDEEKQKARSAVRGLFSSLSPHSS